MSFRKIRVYKKRVHSITATEILDRLDRYVNQNDAEPIRLLVTHWKDQQDALSYREIREAILNGDFDGSLAKEWTDDYSRFVSEKMVPVWRNAMVAGSFGQPIADKLSGKFRFDVSKPTVLNWIDERGAMFVRSVTDQQKEAMRGLIRQYAYEKYSVDELAKVIRPCVGLTDAQSRSVMRYYDTLKENMREQHPRMKASNLRDRCREKTMIYAERMHRRRAYLIAQTEMAYAYNHGMHESMRQAMEQGFMGTMEKRWITSGDLNVCPECDALNGVQIGFDDSFDFGKHQILFTGMGLTPPLHPRCGCAVEYIEVSPPVFEPEPTNMDPYDGQKLDREIYEQAEERIKSNPFRKNDDITKERIVEIVDSVRAYTEADYTNILAAQNNFGGRLAGYSSMMSEEDKAKALEDVKNIGEFLRRSPAYKGDVYRALGFDVGGPYDNGQYEQFRKTYKVGAFVETDTFTSWTKDQDVLKQIHSARTFIDEECEYAVEVTIRMRGSSTGVDISDYAELKGQKEVLFDKDSMLYVKNVTESWKNDEVLQVIIDVEEM